MSSEVPADATGRFSNLAGSWYRFGGSTNISTDPLVLGTAAVAVNWFDGPSCSGTRLSVAQTTSATAHGSWETVHSAVVADVGTVSALYYLYIMKNEAGTEVFGAFVDNAFLSPAIFVDGFESGDVTLWSSSTPKQNLQFHDWVLDPWL